MKLKILDWLWLRMLLVLITLFFCWYFRAYYVLHRHGDIAVTYWSQGIYVIPVKEDTLYLSYPPETVVGRQEAEAKTCVTFTPKPHTKRYS